MSTGTPARRELEGGREETPRRRENRQIYTSTPRHDSRRRVIACPHFGEWLREDVTGSSHRWPGSGATRGRHRCPPQPSRRCRRSYATRWGGLQVQCSPGRGSPGKAGLTWPGTGLRWRRRTPTRCGGLGPREPALQSTRAPMNYVPRPPPPSPAAPHRAVHSVPAPRLDAGNRRSRARPGPVLAEPLEGPSRLAAEMGV